MSSHYSDPRRANDPRTLPDVEVFYHQAGPDIGYDLPSGWYWWACLPGCLPDSDPAGPFDTEEEARCDALLDE